MRALVREGPEDAALIIWMIDFSLFEPPKPPEIYTSRAFLIGVLVDTRMTGCFITSPTLILFRPLAMEAWRKPRFVRNP
jgi:hypothetical protein